MTDYGHDLQFGTFLTPTAADPERPVLLARLCDELALDLVTFQDHPYQPGFLDTWTLISHVVGQTTSVRVAPNVANLPLRNPAVLARSVASLDLLSHGRVELGIGAGAFWEAIEAMGGERLSGGEAVAALDEAIRVIRALWDTDTRGGARVDGAHHRVAGAKRGPAPAHPVGIWVGAYRPRMLRLVGRVADGWLPSLSYLEEGDLARHNAAIDAAATEAGRDPSAVRRLLNVNGRFAAGNGGLLQGPPRQWAEEIAELAIEHGVSAFLLASDDPDDIQRFAQEVAPEARELVGRERLGDHRPPSDEGVPTPAAAEAGVTAAPTRGGLSVTPTPDDGVRLSDERVWDESTRPTGPAADPDRVYTARDEATARHLIEVHDHLRHELAQVRELVERVAAGELDVAAARSDINTMTMRQNNWTLGTYCESYCRVVTTHHTIEDQSLFPHLRAADERLAPVVDRLQAEHLVIHDVLERVDRALVGLVSAPDGVAAVRAEVDLLADTLLSHLAYEERELVEPLARLGFF